MSYEYNELRPAIDEIMSGNNPNISSRVVETDDGPADVAIALIPAGAIEAGPDFSQYDMAVGVARFQDSGSIIVEGHYHEYDDIRNPQGVVHRHQAPCVLYADEPGLAYSSATVSGYEARPVGKDHFAGVAGRVLSYMTDQSVSYDILRSNTGVDAAEMRRMALAMNGCDTLRSLQGTKRGLFLSQGLAKAMNYYVEL